MNSLSNISKTMLNSKYQQISNCRLSIKQDTLVARQCKYVIFPST